MKSDSLKSFRAQEERQWREAQCACRCHRRRDKQPAGAVSCQHKEQQPVQTGKGSSLVPLHVCSRPSLGRLLVISGHPLKRSCHVGLSLTQAGSRISLWFPLEVAMRVWQPGYSSGMERRRGTMGTFPLGSSVFCAESVRPAR